MRNGNRAPGGFLRMGKAVLLFLWRETNSDILLLSDCGSDDHNSCSSRWLLLSLFGVFNRLSLSYDMVKAVVLHHEEPDMEPDMV
jgi:hypothetical protein